MQRSNVALRRGREEQQQKKCWAEASNEMEEGMKKRGTIKTKKNQKTRNENLEEGIVTEEGWFLLSNFKQL